MTSKLKVNELYNAAGVQTMYFDSSQSIIYIPTGIIYTSVGVSNAYGTRTTSNATPSGGNDGDIHFQT